MSALRADLTATAAVGGPEAAQAAALLLAAVEPALRLVLLDLLAEAADDVSTQLGGAAVEVRLRGREPELVVHVPDPVPVGPEPLAEEGTARLTLRLPETLKARVEDAAAAGGSSVNTWLVRAVSSALDPTDERSVDAASRARVENDGTRLTVDVPARMTRKDSTRVPITVSLPPYSSVVSESGDVALTAVGALQDVHVRTGSGDIRVPTARGAVDVRAGDAVLVVGSAAGVRLVSGRGHLRVTAATDVHLKVGHGEAELQRTSGRVTVKGGGVALALHEATGGEVLFDSGAGSARVGVVAGTSVQVDLSSGMGAVRCDVPLERSAPSGGADLRVRLRTGSGDVVVCPA